MDFKLLYLPAKHKSLIIALTPQTQHITDWSHHPLLPQTSRTGKPPGAHASTLGASTLGPSVPATKDAPPPVTSQAHRAAVSARQASWQQWLGQHWADGQTHKGANPGSKPTLLVRAPGRAIWGTALRPGWASCPWTKNFRRWRRKYDWVTFNKFHRR